MSLIYSQNRYIHKDMKDIPEIYRNKSLHIALEFADEKKDWITFKKLFSLDPICLKRHLDITSAVFDYNYLNLSPNERDYLLSIN